MPRALEGLFYKLFLDNFLHIIDKSDNTKYNYKDRCPRNEASGSILLHEKLIFGNGGGL